jgi:protein PhnA
MKACPKCESQYAYSSGDEMFTCPDCGYEWNPNESAEAETRKIVDSNGNEL